MRRDRDVQLCPQNLAAQQLLTNPDCGLPIAGTELDCCCGLPPESYWGCRFYARSSTSQPGALQVRFSRKSGDRAHFYETNLTDYEKRRQLYQPVPAHLSLRRAEPIHNRHQSG